MTCKDCIHRELCADYVSSLAKVQNADVKYISQWLDEIEGKKNQTDNECEHFADRARFVELPRVGDKVYELCRINQFGDYKIDESEIKGFIVDTNGTAFDYELLGKRFFLIREKAEQALKEREENAN